MKDNNKIAFFSAKYVSYLGVLAALVIILQVFSGFMKIGTTTFCLVLIPIVLGGLILGVTAGAILGVVFGFIVIVDAFLGLDAFTLYLIGRTPVFTILLCFAKGIAAGVIPALAYKYISKFSRYLGVIVAAILAPVCNSGIFAVGSTLILKYISEYLTELGMDLSGISSAYLIFVVLIGVNFFVELALNIILSPALYTVNNVVTKKISKGRA